MTPLAAISSVGGVLGLTLGYSILHILQGAQHILQLIRSKHKYVNGLV